jgi:hypothetical protein
MPAPQVHLDLAEAAELAEMLTFLSEWFAGPDHAQLVASFGRFIGTRGYDLADLRTDLDRLTFFLATTTASVSSAPARTDSLAAGSRHACDVGARCRARPQPVPSWEMFVTDLHHFLDLPEDTPGPARRLAEHLGNIAKAATAGDAGAAWETALPCRRWPANRRCPGRMIVLRTDPAAPIRWQCGVCGDDGVISNWAASPFDLRRRRLTLVGPVSEIVIPHEVAAALRELRLLDADCERLVFRIRARDDRAILAATDSDLDELVGFVAAEANHEPGRRRRQRLDTALFALSNAAHAAGS